MAAGHPGAKWRSIESPRDECSVARELPRRRARAGVDEPIEMGRGVGECVLEEHPDTHGGWYPSERFTRPSGRMERPAAAFRPSGLERAR